MNPLSPRSLQLARLLLELEGLRAQGATAGEANQSEHHVAATMKVCEKLRAVLTVLAGTYGFQSLLNRALVQARTQDPSLAEVTVLPNGTLSGFNKRNDEPDTTPNETCGEILVGRLLDLLFIFIGEPLTLKLIGNAWPDVPPETFTLEPKELT